MIIKTNKEEFQKYLRDESNSTSENIEKLYIPENTKELAEILGKEKKPITIYGGGTGLTGGVINNNGIIISTEKLKKFFIDKNNNILKAGAGVTLKELAETLRKENLWYPVDSTEQTATIGGNFSTNASGTRSFGFGCIRNFVNAVTLMFSTGEELELKRKQIISKNLTFDFFINSKKIKFDILDLTDKFSFKNSAGYFMKKNMDLLDLFIGSEGTLGVATEIELNLLKLPYDIIAVLIYFDERNKGLNIVKELKKTNSPEKPISLEYFDKNALKFLNNKIKNIRVCDSAIIFEFIINNKEDENNKYKFIDSFFLKNEISSSDIFITSSKYKNDFIYYVRESLPQIINEYIRQKGLKKVSTDFAVSDNLFDEMINIYDKILSDCGIHYVIFGHIGDNTLHINFLPKNTDEYLKAQKFYDKLAYEIAAIGGTISAEHGIGKLKKKYLNYMYDEKVIDKMREIKKIFDPEYKLNCGNIFD